MFVPAVSAEALPSGEVRCIEVDGRRIALCNVDGSYFAVDDTCTHREASLSDGLLEGTRLTCPLHGAVYDVTTGAVCGGPARDPLACYRTRVLDGVVEVEV